VQTYHERRRVQETASHGKRQPWDRRAVRLVCEFHYDLWQYRNDEVNGRTRIEAQQKLRAEVEDKVRALYDRHPILLARYPSVYSVPLAARLICGNRRTCSHGPVRLLLSSSDCLWSEESDHINVLAGQAASKPH
jgi:hypothetical protein